MHRASKPHPHLIIWIELPIYVAPSNHLSRHRNGSTCHSLAPNLTCRSVSIEHHPLLHDALALSNLTQRNAGGVTGVWVKQAPRTLRAYVITNDCIVGWSLHFVKQFTVLAASCTLNALTLKQCLFQECALTVCARERCTE